MNRRDFFKNTMISIAVSVSGGINKVLAKAVESTKSVRALVGKLGYREESKLPTKNCLNCKSYKIIKDNKDGECELVSMRKVMKSDLVIVNPKGHCVMWAKIPEKK